ncbi:hypothetical protein OPV22_033670 [Ensete ventricosum]|uniref:Uncharacterized protein n=1 Tax=Ensete ventricosum TaxID=4639 RepID=A0AAV8PUX6_ENSVE|nr:hypothetical protein OPV22_033670 [Ensete ventricosum]
MKRSSAFSIGLSDVPVEALQLNAGLPVLENDKDGRALAAPTKQPKKRHRPSGSVSDPHWFKEADGYLYKRWSADEEGTHGEQYRKVLFLSRIVDVRVLEIGVAGASASNAADEPWKLELRISGRGDGGWDREIYCLRAT